MKRTAIVFAIGFATAVVSAIIGLRLYANSPIFTEYQIVPAIPSPIGIIGHIFKGFLLVFAGVFTLGVIFNALPFVSTKIGRRKGKNASKVDKAK